MDALDWAAIIGATAWTPQIFTWGWRVFTIPKISLYLDTQPQIGYTTFGPIFNISLALLTEKKDAILNDFSVTLKHEDGASYKFNWAGLSESISEMQNPLGQVMSVTKSSLPLVIRVPRTGAAQAFVRFQHNKFKVNIKKPLAAALEQYNHLKANGKFKTEDDVASALSEKEFDNVMKTFESEFIWMAGNYTATFDICSPNKIEYSKCEYTFKLSQDDIGHLRKNLAHIKLYYLESAMSEVIADYKFTNIPWVWQSPELKR